MRSFVPSSPFPESSNSFNNFCRNLSPIFNPFDSPRKNSNPLMHPAYLSQDACCFSSAKKTVSITKKESIKRFENVKEIHEFNIKPEEFDIGSPSKPLRSSSKSDLFNENEPFYQTVKKAIKPPPEFSQTMLKISKQPSSIITPQFICKEEESMIETSDFPFANSKPNFPQPNFKHRRPSPLKMNECTDENSPHKERKTHCNCSKSQCLKLYCECLAKGLLCSPGCRCVNCRNNRKYQKSHNFGIQTLAEKSNLTLQMKSNIFFQKINIIPEEHNKEKKGLAIISRGCKCKKSMCRKKYCECFINKVKCSRLCQCQGCKNRDRSINKEQNFKKIHIISNPQQELTTVKMEAENVKTKGDKPTQKVFVKYIGDEEIESLKSRFLKNKRVYTIENTEDWLYNAQNYAEIGNYFKVYGYS